MDLEQCYQTFSRAIESVNVVIATYKVKIHAFFRTGFTSVDCC